MNTDTNYISILKTSLEERCKKNSHYSLRAFARDLNVSVARLSRWMNGLDGISNESAQKIASKLGLNSKETEILLAEVDSQFGRSKSKRKTAESKLNTLSEEYKIVTSSVFNFISDWYNLGLLALTETKDFQNDEKWISKRLGISIYQVQGALERLEKLEMIEIKDGKIKPTGLFYVNPGMSSQSVKLFHNQILDKAKAALVSQSTMEREYSSSVFAVSSTQLKEAKEFIQKFTDEFEQRFAHNARKQDQVYALHVNYFKLTENI